MLEVPPYKKNVYKFWIYLFGILYLEYIGLLDILFIDFLAILTDSCTSFINYEESKYFQIFIWYILR